MRRAMMLIATPPVLTLVVAALASATFASPGHAGSWALHDPAVTSRITAIGKSENRAMEHLDHLCNQIGARPAGTGEHQEACEWAAEKFREFGLANVHLEACGEVPCGPFDMGVTGFIKRVFRKILPGDADAALVPVYNVVADIPGTDWPDEYVILGAHIDSAPIGTGATDNGAGVAAVMEAARILIESGARPKRTIRFMLFAGEESGLVGSRGYVEAHPELVPKITAVYNMDHGCSYIYKVQATEPLLADMQAIFAPVMRLDEEMPFEVELADYLPKADPNCCRGAMLSRTPGKEAPSVLTKVMKKNPNGSVEPVDADLAELGITAVDIEKGMDSEGRKIVVSGGCGASQGCGLSEKDLADMGIDLKQLEAGDGRVRIMAAGSSDHAPFLAADIPSFWWGQEENGDVPYPAHSREDTYDKVIPRYLEHSATVIALGALGTANLDHMLSRERLTAQADLPGEGPAPVETPACGSEKKVYESACCP